MASEDQKSNWPLPGFNFQIIFANGVTGSFQDVAGFDPETKEIVYRHGNNPTFYPIKMPDIGKISNITLRRGVFATEIAFLKLSEQIKMGTLQRSGVVVKLLDASGATGCTWTLNNAWPTKMTMSEETTEGNEVVVESLEIAFETMTISGG